MKVCEGGAGTEAASLRQALLFEDLREVEARGGGHLLGVLLDAVRVDLLKGPDVGRADVNGLRDPAGILLEGHAADADLLGLHVRVEQTYGIGQGLDGDNDLEGLMLKALVDAHGFLRSRRMNPHPTAADLQYEGPAQLVVNDAVRNGENGFDTQRSSLIVGDLSVSQAGVNV